MTSYAAAIRVHDFSDDSFSVHVILFVSLGGEGILCAARRWLDFFCPGCSAIAYTGGWLYIGALL